jgi:hypothetical protein
MYHYRQTDLMLPLLRDSDFFSDLPYPSSHLPNQLSPSFFRGGTAESYTHFSSAIGTAEEDYLWCALMKFKQFPGLHDQLCSGFTRQFERKGREGTGRVRMNKKGTGEQEGRDQILTHQQA